MTQTPTLHSVINKNIDRRMNSIAKALPGVVVSYDADSKTCSVKPAVHRLVPTAYDENEDYVEEIAVIPNVPVAWPCGRNFRVVGTLSPGDSVLLVACDRDISGWRRSGKASEPDSAQKHSWSSAIAIPGLEPDGEGFGEPGDAAALASMLDKLIRVLMTVGVGSATAVPAAVSAAFPGIAGTVVTPIPPGSALGPEVTTTGSAVLKLEE